MLLLTCASIWKHKADKKMTYSKVFWWYEWDATHAYHWKDCRGQRGQLGGVQSGWVEVTHKVLLPSWLHFLNYEHRKLKKKKNVPIRFPNAETSASSQPLGGPNADTAKLLSCRVAGLAHVARPTDSTASLKHGEIP